MDAGCAIVAGAVFMLLANQMLVIRIEGFFEQFKKERRCYDDGR